MIVKFRNDGFTLIEMLVVISVFCLLAAIVTIPLHKARDKGVVGAAMQFEGTNFHALGSDALVMYDFDFDPTGDSSGNNNTLVLQPDTGGNSPVINTAAGQTGSGLDTNGGGYAVSTNNVVLGSSWTISAWVYPMNNGSQFFLSLHYPYMSFDNDHFKIAWKKAGSTCSNGWGHADIEEGVTRQLNTWYQVTGTHDDSTEETHLYINGQLVNPTNNPGNTKSCDDGYQLYLGQHDTGASPFRGHIDTVRVFSRPLTAREVGKMYAMEKAVHEVATNRKD